MNAVDRLNAARRVQNTLRKDPDNIPALLELATMLGTLKKPDLERKRGILKRVLSLDPVHPAARGMLLEMDRAAMGGVSIQRPTPIVPADPPQGSIHPPAETQEGSLVLRYSLAHQVVVFGLMAITLTLCLSARREPEVLLVFSSFFLALIIPLWFVSAAVTASPSGLRVVRLFGIVRLEIAWRDIERIKPNALGQGLLITAKDGKVLEISFQLHGYPALVEVLRRVRPDLFNLTQGSPFEAAAPAGGIRTFQKSFLAKHMALCGLILASLIFLGTVLTAQILPALFVAILLFFFWKSALYAPYQITVAENRLSICSFLNKQQLTARQIRTINLISRRNLRGVARNFIQVELLQGNTFALSGFPEGNEILYATLKSWWSKYQIT